MTILDELDNKLEMFKQAIGTYPAKIITDKKSYDKIMENILKFPDSSTSWTDNKENYRGIPIEIKEDNFLKLEKE